MYLIELHRMCEHLLSSSFSLHYFRCIFYLSTDDVKHDNSMQVDISDQQKKIVLREYLFAK